MFFASSLSTEVSFSALSAWSEPSVLSEDSVSSVASGIPVSSDAASSEVLSSVLLSSDALSSVLFSSDALSSVLLSSELSSLL